MLRGFQFLLVSAAFAYAGFVLPSFALRLAAFWTAISFLGVAVGYFGAGGRVFGKRPDGTLAPLGLVAFAPYLVLALIIAAVCRGVFREPPCQQISDRLFFGRRLLGRESGLLERLKIIAVLDLTAATPEPRAIRAGRAYRSLPLLDATAPSLDLLRDAVRWIAEHSEKGPVYVHCAAGHGRAGLIAAAHLLAIGEAADAGESVQKLREVRPLVRLSREQARRLDQYAAALSMSRE